MGNVRCTNTGLELSAGYTYTEDQLTAIETETTTYGFTYGDFGLRTSVKAGLFTLAEYEYTQYTDLIQKLTYGNDDSVSYTYDSADRLITETYEDGATVSYQYDNDGGLAKVTDSETGITSTYYYDFIDRLCHYSEEAEDFSLVMKYTFDEMDNISLVEEIIDGSRRTTRVAYDDDQRVSWIRKATVKETYTYDAYSRVTNKATTQSDEPRLTEQIVYRIPATGSTSGQVSYMTVTAAAEGGYSDTFSYSYDANGNITDVISGGYLTSYTYDTQNQLVREDNQAAGKSWTWTYDNAGNILSRSEYAYTTGTLGDAVDTIDYVYSTGTWGDLLLTYDGVGITYDEIGNPLTMGTRTYTWKHGRELATLTEDGTTWTYTYSADGLRTKRTNGTNTYHYVYADGQLVKAIANNRGMRFSYDANGTPMAVYYAGSEYYYVTNLQGDVVAILDYNGAAVVTYTYDAWGKILSIGGAMATTLGEYNPLRYRGYVYDVETGLYYLQSRYYDPAIGRFVNADALTSTGQGFIGNNMFVYCGNDPVDNRDSTGYWAEKYPGFKWTPEGFDLPAQRNFLSRSFCLSFAKDIIKQYAKKEKKLYTIFSRCAGMSATRIAQELWFHAVVYYVGSPIKKVLSKVGVSWNKLNDWVIRAKKMEINNDDNRAWIFATVWYAAPVVKNAVRAVGSAAFAYIKIW